MQLQSPHEHWNHVFSEVFFFCFGDEHFVGFASVVGAEALLCDGVGIAAVAVASS